jgi:hypothetical protein
MIECFQRQSLNTCKRVAMSGHIPKLFETWGDEVDLVVHFMRTS